MNHLLIHALIPARGGSKTIPRKNVKMYKDKPLLVHSIDIAKKCPFISRIVISTDCEEIKKVAMENGAEVPFIRPSDISGDFSTDLECFQHYLLWLTYAKQDIPDIIVHLRPTYPERCITDVNKMIKTFLKVRNQYDCLRTVIPIDKSPFKMYTLSEHTLQPLFTSYGNMKEPYNHVRQVLPQCYLHNGYIDIVNTKTISELKSMTGHKIYPYVMKLHNDLDIDTYQDWEKSKAFVKEKKEDKDKKESVVALKGVKMSISPPIDIPKK